MVATGILLPRTVLVLPLSGQQDQQALWLTGSGCHVTWVKMLVVGLALQAGGYR